MDLGSTRTQKFLRRLISPNDKDGQIGELLGMMKEANGGLGKERLLLFRIKYHSINILSLQLANIYSHYQLKYQRKERDFQNLCG